MQPLQQFTLGKMTTWLTPLERASRTVSTSPFRQFRRYTPGMEAMGSFFSPSCTKTGRMKFAGEMCVSEMALRIVPDRRLRRGREGMSCGQAACVEHDIDELAMYMLNAECMK